MKKETLRQKETPIKKGDTVVVITGKEKGKTGKVILVLPKKERVLVEKLNFVKRHSRPTQKQRQGGIIEKEASIHWSNVAMMCTKCNKPVRRKIKIDKDGKKTRVCVKCNEQLDTNI